MKKQKKSRSSWKWGKNNRTREKEKENMLILPFFSVFRTIPTYISSKRNRKKSFRSFFWYSGDYKNIVTPFNTRNHERNSSFLNGDVKFNFCPQWTKKVPIESADDGDDDSIVRFFLATFVSSEIGSKVKNDFLCTDKQSLVPTASKNVAKKNLNTY